VVVMDAHAWSSPPHVKLIDTAADRHLGVCFDGPDRVVTTDGQEIATWSLDGPDWGAARLAVRDEPGARCPVRVAARGEVCVLDRAGTVACFDARTLAPVGEPRELSGSGGTVLFGSPADTCHALGGDGFVDVVTAGYLALRSVADHPQASWTPADLALVTKSAPPAACRPAVRPLRDLVSRCLRHWFGGEVRLGQAAAPVGDDDIAISQA
jgi:hypothetical protein